MHRLSTAITLSGAASFMIVSSAAPQSAVDQLAHLKWTHRPVVILSASRDDPRVARQIAALDHVRAEADDRQIKVLREATPDGPLRKAVGDTGRGFAVVLVGKDGGVKQVWRAPVDPQVIFGVIDRMPMRQREMKG